MDRLLRVAQAALTEPLGAFFLGLLVGSYLNVVALRWGVPVIGTPRWGRQSDHAGGNRSRCPHCQRVLRWWELVPLVGYVLLRGACARCGRRLSLRYPIVELLTGATFALLIGAGDGSMQVVALFVVASLLIVLALIDLEQGVLPDQLTIGGAMVVLLYLVATSHSSLLTLHSSLSFDHWLWGGLLGAGLLGVIVLVTRGRGMGLGDVKLGLLIGLGLGGSAALIAIWSAFILGALVGVGLVLAGRAKWRGTELPFGPFLVLGWLIAARWSDPIVAWYTGI